MPPDARVRIDQWLWAARFFRTRALAAAAIAGGKVQLNGVRVKRGKEIKPGDEIRLRLGPYEYLVRVRALSARRGPAAEAHGLFEEDPATGERRQRLAEQHRLARQSFAYGEGKPSRKQRRDIRRIMGKE